MEKRRPISGAEWADRIGVCDANKFPQRRTGGQLACQQRCSEQRRPMIFLNYSQPRAVLEHANTRDGEYRSDMQSTTCGDRLVAED